MATAQKFPTIIPANVRYLVANSSQINTKPGAVIPWQQNTRRINYAKIASAHHRTNLSGYIFATKACIDNRKNMLNCNMSSTCPHNMVNVANGWDWFASLGHPSKFQRVSRHGFVTEPTSLNGGQPTFARCLAVFWAGTLYVHIWGCCPLTQFCHMLYSLYA